MRLCVNKQMDTELFKSEVCHRLRELGELEFIIELLKEEWITLYWEKQWYFESLYLLAMLDFLSKSNDVELYSGYDYYRTARLKNILWPRDVLFIDKVTPKANIKDMVLEECRNRPCSREFLKYNIIEGDIFDVK